MVNTNFKFYKRVTDVDAFGRNLVHWLFERYRKVATKDAPREPRD